MRYDHRALIVGKTRSGKSTFARYLFAHFVGVRRLVVNVKGRLDIGVAPVHDVAAIDWSAPIVNFVPRSFDRQVFEDLYAAAWAHRNIPTVIWLDEAAAVTSANAAPDSLLVVQQQGGEWGVGHVVCAQRCKNIKMELRTEAEEIYIFVPPPSQADLQWLADEIDVADVEEFTVQDLRARLRDLHATYGDNAFLRWTRATGQLEDCEPLDAGWVDAPLHKAARPRSTSSQATAPNDGPVAVSE